MNLSKAPVVKCKKCGKVHKFEITDFTGPELASDERSMGYEIQYTWETEVNCSKCQNSMAITIEGWEYPAGVFNYEEFSTEGCLLIEKPELEVIFDDDYEEEL